MRRLLSPLIMRKLVISISETHRKRNMEKTEPSSEWECRIFTLTFMLISAADFAGHRMFNFAEKVPETLVVNGVHASAEPLSTEEGETKNINKLTFFPIYAIITIRF